MMPPQLQQLMQMQQGGGGAPPGMAGPAAAPMATPQKAEGRHAQGMAKLQIAVRMMMQAAQDLDPMSKEFDAIKSALRHVSKVAGKGESNDIVPAEMRMLMEGSGMQSPEMMAMRRAQMAGGPPGGIPGM